MGASANRSAVYESRACRYRELVVKAQQQAEEPPQPPAATHAPMRRFVFVSGGFGRHQPPKRGLAQPLGGLGRRAPDLPNTTQKDRGVGGYTALLRCGRSVCVWSGQRSILPQTPAYAPYHWWEMQRW